MSGKSIRIEKGLRTTRDIDQMLGNRILEESVAWWQDCIHAMRVMVADAPNPADKELMEGIIRNLELRQRAIMSRMVRIG